jgi:phosphoribosylanthranilate isomerase
VSGRVRIKICGISNVEDALAAVDAGADLVGINFVPGSPRYVEIREAEAICKVLADHPVERVALFQDPSWDDVEHVLRRVEFERVQFHGSESEEDVETVDLPVIKAIRGADVAAADAYPGALLLLDHPSEGGGQGNSWDWSEAAEIISLGYDVILAGGLTPDNVGEALHGVGDIPPWGVDVATGVEGEGHRKDPARMRAFIEAVRKAEDESTETTETTKEK